MKRIPTLLLFVFLFLVMFIMIKSPFNFYDEGFAVTGAGRVLHGEVPYRDFWAIYPPGQFYAIAAAFKLFGENLLTSRTYDTLGRFLAVIAIYGIALKTSRNLWLARLAAVVCGFFLAASWFYAYAVYPALCLALWGILCWLNALESGRRRWQIGAGVILGAGALFRWDIATYAAIGITAASLLQILLQRGSLRNWLRDPLRPLLPIAWILVPMALTAGLGYLAVGLQSGWGVLFEQVFYFPAFLLRKQRWLAYPPLLSPGAPNLDDWVRFYLPLLTLGLAALLYAYRLIKDPQARQAAAGGPGFSTPIVGTPILGAVGLILFGAFAFNQALSRYDLIHVTPASIVTFLVALALVGQARGLSKLRWVFPAAILLTVVLTWVYLLPALKTINQNARAFQPWGCYSQIEKAACVFLDPSQEQTLREIQSVTRPGDFIYSGVRTHDQLLVNDAGFYFLSGLRSATRYHELHPGVANTLPVQQEMIASLEKNQPQWIVDYRVGNWHEPNASAISSGVHALDDYLASHYRSVQEFGLYRVYERRK
jgi:hypothetical protein